MAQRMLIAGAGIGGLSAALACARAGWSVRVLERAAGFSEVGAGIQLGPNVTRVLHAWGLADALASMAAFPSHLQVRSAQSGHELGVLPLGKIARQAYGAPYATLHRADLHRLLLDAVCKQGEVELRPDCALTGFTESAVSVSARTDDGGALEGDILLGADGLWSVVRQGLLRDGPPRVTGHVAYRALLPQADLPAHLRSQHITVWLGARLHVVQYPVRCGASLNVVGIVHSGTHASGAPGHVADETAGDSAGWDQSSSGAELRAALVGAATPLQDLVGAIEPWRCWVLCDRVPVAGADQLARGRIALLGDAAHPMRPYLAQGAGMAIEDSAELGRVLEPAHYYDPVAALQRYAAARWQRNARVQARARRNGRIFHARGPLRWGRDLALRVLGERVLDLPWLYRY